MKAMKLSVLFLTVVMVVMTSCKKEEDAKPAASMNKATITGFVYADLDMTEPGDELVPQGTKLFLIVNTEELFLQPDPNTVYPYKYYETTVGSDGKYSFTIDVGNRPLMSVGIYGNDFWYQRQISLTMTELTVFKFNISAVGPIIPKMTIIRDIYYQPN